MKDYLDSQGRGNFIKDEITVDAGDGLKAKSAKLAVMLRTAAGNKITYLLGLKIPMQIPAKLADVNGGWSKGILSSLQ